VRSIFVPVGVAIGWLVGVGAVESWISPNCAGSGCRIVIALAGVVGGAVGAGLAFLHWRAGTAATDTRMRSADPISRPAGPYGEANVVVRAGIVPADPTQRRCRRATRWSILPTVIPADLTTAP
jgi:hypothetical protein